MPIAPVNAEGAVLYYEDSGAPFAGSKDYVTLVLIHGTCFHSAVYRPMIPFAAQSNLRLVLLNLRGYPGSTPLSIEDIQDMRGPSVEAQERAMRHRGLEIAAFIRWFIEAEDVPPIRAHNTGSNDARCLTGGLSVPSWSGGNYPTIAMLAHPAHLPEETRRLFDTHLRSLVMHERIDPPPMYDPPRRPVHLSNNQVDVKYLPTTSSAKMTPDMFRSLTHPDVMRETQHLTWTLNPEVYKKNLARALYDCRSPLPSAETHLNHQPATADGGGMNERWLPSLRVHVVWCDMTVGDCAWAAAVIHA
ncbi:hypothetical protein C8Q77DRAFT_1272422 [Trametes polyzona]|nr:hypothetical protein C8Q77DRAFT_1272422 [Trametes polyzona]